MIINESRLNESSFDLYGSTYKAAFGHYSKDGESISRDDYFKAKEQTNSSKSKASGRKSMKQSSPKINKKAFYKLAASTIDSYSDLINSSYSEEYDKIPEVMDIMGEMADTEDGELYSYSEAVDIFKESVPKLSKLVRSKETSSKLSHGAMSELTKTVKNMENLYGKSFQ